MTAPPYTPIIEVEVGGTWVDVSQRARRHPVVIERGRSDEASATQPSKTTIVLDNTDGAFTPGNAMSPYYPDAKRGMPVRVRMPGGTSHLAQAGGANNYSSTPDHASLDITGPLFVAAEATVPSLHSFGGPVVAYDLVYKWGAAGVRSYYLFAGGGRIWLYWSNDGTTENLVSSAYVPITADGRMAYGAELVTNDGAGGHYVQFYVSDRLGNSWTAVGDRQSAFVGTTSVFSGTAALLVGRHAGKTFKAEVRSGTRFGTIVANPDFTTRPTGTSSFTDSTGKTWSYTGTARIEDYSTRFYGAADAVELGWPLAAQRGSNKPSVAHVTLTASVALRRMLQGRKTLESTLRRLVTAPRVADNVIAYWPMEDGSDSTQAASPIAGIQPMIVGGDFTFASDSTFTASAPLLSFAGGQPGGWNGIVPPSSATQFRIDCFAYIQTGNPGAGYDPVMQVATSGRVALWRIGVRSDQFQILGLDADGGTVVNFTQSTDATFFGQWVLWSFNIEQNGSAVDWTISIVPIPQGVAFGNTGSAASSSLGRVTRVLNLFEDAPPDGMSVGHFIVSTGLVLGWLAGGDTAWVGETAAHRFHRLCREEEIPYAIVGDPTVLEFFRGDPDRSELMGPQRQLPLLELLEECAVADSGRFLERKDAPGLVYRTRNTLYNQTSAVTFDVSQNGLTAPFGPIIDDQFYRNDITCTRPDGSFGRATTDPPPEPTATYDESVEVNVEADSQLENQAGWRLHLGTWAGFRYPAWNTALNQAGTGVIKAWTDIVEGDKIAATGLMDQHSETAAVLVEGWQETLDGFTWTAAVNGSPADLWTVGVLDDNPATPNTSLARLESDLSVLASGIDSDDTSLSVTVTGPLWTTNTDYFPFNILIGGEEMTVSAVSGVSSPQTFTVSARSVNGVVKSHLAGAAITVADPFRLAL